MRYLLALLLLALAACVPITVTPTPPEPEPPGDTVTLPRGELLALRATLA